MNLTSMKTIVSACAAMLLGSAASSPAFTVPWSCFHGGAKAQAGSWSVASTVGQPVVALATGGSFKVDAGYMRGATAPPPPPCLGDTNGDRVVNTADLVFFLGKFGQGVAPGSPADLNNDGVVNTADLVVFLGRFGSLCP